MYMYGFFLMIALNVFLLETGSKIDVHKTFTRHSGCLWNVLCMLNLRPVPRGLYISFTFIILYSILQRALLSVPN